MRSAVVPARAAGVALLTTTVLVLVVAVPTDLVDTPWFAREIPPTWWAWPSLLASSVLAGLITATYVRLPGAAEPGDDRVATRGSQVAGLLTFFAVGCPVCNKLVLLALGTAGAVTWFQPVQPWLQAAALGLLAWALVRRLRTRRRCPVPSDPRPQILETP